nr:MAG TPA: Glycine rich protein [Caudoviricetes sp.]
MSTVTNYAYAGAKQTVTLKPGRYKLECWGAQGGYRSSSSYGGLGGYSVGEISLEKQTTLYVYVGGSGNTGKTNGGFNGGGKRSTYNGGGGATDIRVGTDSLYARVIVAGGGGSDGATNRNGMYGGGETGGTATQNYGSGGGGGTQTAGGTGGNSNSGTFGQGGEGKSASSGYAGAGGGGWYGGGGSYPDGSGDDDRGGGGGSGFAWTGKNAPSGYLLGSAYYLTNASTKAGNTSFTAPGGSTETGHSGDGYARITCLELYKQVPDTPASFRQTAKDYFSISLAWGAVECTGYKLYRDGTLISTQTGTTYTDTSVEPNNTYTYKLVAYNSEGDSDPTTLSAKTSEGFVVKIFEIASAVFTPNPVNINSTTKLSVEVTETVKILEPYYYYSGDLYAGEV